MPEVTTFSLFVGETFQYILGIKGIEWYMDAPFELPKGVRNVFDINFGEAIVCYLVRHDKEIKEAVKDSSFSNIDEIKKLATKVITKLCKEDCFLMDVIRIIALFADFALRCCNIDRPELIPALVDYLNSFYKKYLQEPMKVVGGYYALMRFAKQYYDYHKDSFNMELQTTETRFKFGESSESCTSNIDKEFEALSKFETTFTEGNSPQTSDFEKELEALSKFETTFTEGNLEIPQTSEKEFDAVANFNALIREGNWDFPDTFDLEEQLIALASFESMQMKKTKDVPVESNTDKNTKISTYSNTEKTIKISSESNSDKYARTSAELNTDEKVEPEETNIDEKVEPEETNTDKKVEPEEANSDEKVEPEEKNSDEKVEPEEANTDLNASFEIRSILRRALERDCLAARIDYCDENASPKRRRDC